MSKFQFVRHIWKKSCSSDSEICSNQEERVLCSHSDPSPEKRFRMNFLDNSTAARLNAVKLSDRKAGIVLTKEPKSVGCDTAD